MGKPMPARIGQVLWRHFGFVMTGIAVATLIAMGVGPLKAGAWGGVIGIAFLALKVAVTPQKDERAKWGFVGVILCVDFVLLLAAAGIIH
jgi:hypothetical protein